MLKTVMSMYFTVSPIRSEDQIASVRYKTCILKSNVAY